VAASIAIVPDDARPAASPEPDPRAGSVLARRLDRRLERAGPLGVALALGAFALAVYLASNPVRSDVYAHYVWQADAWLHGRTEIAWPVSDGRVRNDYYHDVVPVPGKPGFAQIPFPPLPAVVLLPAVALFGLNTDAELVAAFVGALNAALAWLVAYRLARRPSVALVAAAFFAFGTVAWVAAARGSTWYLAHDLAITFSLLAVLAALAGHQVRAGLALGVATLARLTVTFGAPFVLVNGSGTAPRRTLATLAGLAPPIAFLVLYNLASTGQVLQPGYDELYRTETPPVAGLYHPDWLLVDPRYIPQNLAIMLFEPPRLEPQCAVVPLQRCAHPSTVTLVPDPLGMSVLLTSPGWLLALAALRRPRSSLVIGSALAIGAIAIVDLMHFSQGWVQFGYRFSNDWAPFGLVLVTIGLDRIGLRRGAVALIALSVVVNLWGVAWAEVFGW
jgi:hypothetical protein